jgi:hypothetical protein
MIQSVLPLHECADPTAADESATVESTAEPLHSVADSTAEPLQSMLTLLLLVLL